MDKEKEKIRKHDYYLKHKEHLYSKHKEWYEKNKSKNKTHIYYKRWVLKYQKECPICKKKIHPLSKFCFYCSHKDAHSGKNNSMWGRRKEKSPHWRGGKRKNKQGYTLICVATGNRRAIYQSEHRIVMEEEIGRKLEKWECIHHKNGIKDDNRIENLVIVVNKKHNGVIRCPHCLKEFLIK